MHQQHAGMRTQLHHSPQHLQHHNAAAAAVAVGTTTTRHLAPSFHTSRHGSLPNVNAAMGLQVASMPGHILSSDDFPVVNAGGGGGGLVSYSVSSTAAATSSLGDSSGHIRTSGSGGHVSVRDSVGASSTGPIRHKSRIDTSPYGSDRFSGGGSSTGGGNSSHHLSPPDPSWRRVHSDSSLHHSVGQMVMQQGEVTVGSHSGGGIISPLQGASPTITRKGYLSLVSAHAGVHTRARTYTHMHNTVLHK